MHTAWYSIEELPYCFSRPSIKLLGHTRPKIVDFDRTWRFCAVPPVWSHWLLRNDAESLKWYRRGALLFFHDNSSISNVTWDKNCRFWSKLYVSLPLLRFELTDDQEMMHKAWKNISSVPYCFSRSYVIFQHHMGHKIAIFDLNWALTDCNCSLNSMMALKWLTKLDVAYRKCPMVFPIRASNFKFIRAAKTNTIWVRSLGQSQLSNPPDVPCVRII